ncbi:hypothetical protein HY086_03410 [Candidatus Gottesmanbacteria bacterium]|nr:hypothetical protein [Candidatus Gottesmanbacteria bacterium]
MNTLSQRNIFLVVGPFGDGKTHFLNLLRDVIVPEFGFPLEYVPISDAHTITKRLLEDDETSGVNHYHPATREAALVGDFHHKHDDSLNIYPFTVAGNQIITAMTIDFLHRLNQVPAGNTIHLAEWSLGVNTNKPSEPASRTTAFSCDTIAQYLHDGTYPTEGFQKVFAVIHPVTTFDNRLRFNAMRDIPSSEDIALGRKSWMIAPEGMNITGEDNFEILVPVLQSFGIPFIVDVPNNVLPDEIRYDEAQREIIFHLRKAVLDWSEEVWHGGERGQRGQSIELG